MTLYESFSTVSTCIQKCVSFRADPLSHIWPKSSRGEKVNQEQLGLHPVIICSAPEQQNQVTKSWPEWPWDDLATRQKTISAVSAELGHTVQESLLYSPGKIIRRTMTYINAQCDVDSENTGARNFNSQWIQKCVVHIGFIWNILYHQGWQASSAGSEVCHPLLGVRLLPCVCWTFASPLLKILIVLIFAWGWGGMKRRAHWFYAWLWQSLYDCCSKVISPPMSKNSSKE